MLSEYWWVLIALILLLMIFYPKERSKKVTRPKKKLNLNFNPVLKNLNGLTSFYVGLV